MSVESLGDNSCTCAAHQFSCGDCKCIPQKLVCDGSKDCENNMDEQGCRHSPQCPADHFTCWNQHCARLEWVCDGDNDCGDDSDELMCPPKNCSRDEFKCDNGKCVLAKWRCDGDDDCADMSDENCQHSCNQGQFQCGDGMCIEQFWVCDKDPDCADLSDEQGCDQDKVPCQEGEFLCLQQHICIPSQKFCDGVVDCEDGEDERCDKPTGHHNCKKGEFQCNYGVCINETWRCDMEPDCDDKSDETNCSYNGCLHDQFQCNNGYCISKKWQCDGDNDCSDNSDETGCGSSTCSSGQYHCNNGQCIGNTKVCDMKNDCGDNSDETNCHLAASCGSDNGGCSHTCQQTKIGAKCICPRGYLLGDDGKTCEDFDECSVVGTCSQICKNVPGSYDCSCAAGYTLKPDGRGCKATGEKAYLIFANRVDIRRVLPDRSEYDSILQGLENAIALDFHHDKGYVYWSDVTLDKIKRAYLNGSEIMEVVKFGLESPGGLAVDWIHEKLFWTDSGTSRIEVTDLEGNMRKVLIWERLEKPRAIVLHPGQGAIFWTDWGSVPKIERSSMDGTERSTIANTSLFWPNGLTLDYAADKLYWADAKHHVIECAGLDGKNRRTVISQGLPHPFALTLFEDELYWTDWHTKSINKANKFTGNDVETVSSRLHFPMDIHTLHPQRQPPARNHCGRNNGGCSHLCLPNSRSYSCACPTGLHLKEDKKTCIENIDVFLLFTTRSDVRRITLNSPDQSDVVIPLSNIESTMAVDFDSTNDMIYWTDVGANTISRAKWDGNNEEIIVGSSLDSPAGLSLDWGSRKIYWTEDEMNLIEVANLDGSMRSILIWEDLDQPRDIIVDPISGYMFWTDWGKNAKIEKAGMDGLMKTVLISENLKWPNGLAIDYNEPTPRLYWTDAGKNHIESSTQDGKDRKVVIAVDLPRPFGLTLYGDKLYWTDWMTKGIHSANKKNGSGRETLQSNLGHVMDIRVFHRHRQPISTICAINNGECSHLCLLAPLPRGHTCACPTGVLMMQDGKTCQKDMTNFLIFARRSDIRKISLDVPYYASVVLPIGELRNAIALSVDNLEGKVYWTDTVLDKIMRANLDGSQVETVIGNGLDTPDGMAVDYIGRKVYWTDTGLNRIEVANLDGSMRKILFWEDLDKPRAIAVYYEAGYLFWTDWGKFPKIERSYLDGQERTVIVMEDLGWPNGLVVDKPDRLIWADARTEKIETCDLYGKNRKVLVSSVIHPYGLAVWKDYIFWTDWEKTSIFQANKYTGEEFVEPVQKKLSGLMDIHAVQMDDFASTRMVNKCAKNNGGCSHMCLPNPYGTSCACPTGLQLRTDQKTCESMPEEYLLFASRNSIRRISLGMPDHTDVFLPLNDLHNVIALDYDYRDRKLYFTDVQLDVIRRANLNGTDMETIVSHNLSTTDGLAVDWIARNLYWTDTGRDVIEVSWLDGSCRKVLVKDDLDQPRAIALYPKKGLMFWTDWGVVPKIEKAFLDGSNRKVIVDTDLGFPNGLSIDYQAKRLYWVDAKLDKIETLDLNGKNRVTLIDHVAHPFGLTVFGDYIFWTDWQTEVIQRANKNTGKDAIVIQRFLEGLMDIEVVTPTRQVGMNDCSDRNGGCTHLCFANPTGHTCACPDVPDPNRPCFQVPTDGNFVPTNQPPQVTPKWPPFICTPQEEELELCTTEKQQEIKQQSGTPSKGAYIALAVVIVVALGGLALIIIIWRRQKRRHYTGEELSALTSFSNPSYQQTSTETINSDRPPREWHIFRFSKKSERVLISNSPSVDDTLTDSEMEALFKSSGSRPSPGRLKECLPI
ncbi:hypothetical protein ACJMK2_021223 [Sinanodonta woodiana]|uniref:EGF-like domain-containing protein n=1 Tax=Sinanodonta woodiana TaxID=1069815 RepID=A0ABD3U2Z5_SINWO